MKTLKTARERKGNSGKVLQELFLSASLLFPLTLLLLHPVA